MLPRKKTNIGNILTIIGMAGIAFGLSGEEIEELKGIVQDADSLYIMITGVVVSAIWLMHKIIKIASPIRQFFIDWSIKKALQ